MTPILYFYFCLWYQTTSQIMEEDILNYSQIVMFHPVPFFKLNEFKNEGSRGEVGAGG